MIFVTKFDFMIALNFIFVMIARELCIFERLITLKILRNNFNKVIMRENSNFHLGAYTDYEYKHHESVQSRA